MLLLTGAVLATLRALDVRDWRCYGVVFLWPPVLSAIQTGNVTLLLGLCAALVWRFRASVVLPAALVGVTLAAKFFLWPLAVWLAATRRVASRRARRRDRPRPPRRHVGRHRVRRARRLPGAHAPPAGLDRRGLVHAACRCSRPRAPSDGLARAVWLAGGLALLTAMVVVGRRGDERRALRARARSSARADAHRLAALLRAPARRRRSRCARGSALVWFVPLAMVVAPGAGIRHPSRLPGRSVSQR